MHNFIHGALVKYDLFSGVKFWMTLYIHMLQQRYVSEDEE